MSDHCIISTTVETLTLSNQIAQALLEERVAACIQQTKIQSQYLWQGKIETADEILLQIKTRTDLFDRVEKIILSLHSYEVPEIIMSPITKANQAYLNWIEKECRHTI